MSESIERTGVIYALSDPRTGAVRYVGWTINLRTRIRDHLKPSRLAGTQRRDRWLKALGSAGLQPSVIILEHVAADWAAAERKWITHFRREAADLTNLTDGGEGAVGRRHTLDARRRMSEKRKGKKPSPLALLRAKEKNSGITRSPETIAKMKAAGVGKWIRSFQVRAVLSAVASARTYSAETREKIGAAHRGKKRGPMPQQVKDKLSAANKGRGREHRIRFWAALSPEERSQIAKKGHETRRAMQGHDEHPGA